MSTIVINQYGSVKVTNLPIRTTYYRGRYYRTHLTVSVTETQFEMTIRATFFGHSDGARHLAYYMIAPDSTRFWYHKRHTFRENSHDYPSQHPAQDRRQERQEDPQVSA